MGRFAIQIIWMIIVMILSIIIPPRRRNYFYRHSIYGRDYNNNNSTMDYIRMFIRRRRALSKAKDFIKRKKHNITLKNSNVMLIFDTKFKTFALIDIKNIKRSATVIWAEQLIKMADITNISPDVDTEMEKTFDSLCRSFNTTSNYLGVLQVLKNKFSVVKENNLQEKRQESKHFTKQETTPVQQNKVNINSLNETELAKLPGISIIQAKKIIERINLKGDFKNVEEFYDEFKIKPHFKKKLDIMICAEIAQKQAKTKNNDRIIDL